MPARNKFRGGKVGGHKAPQRSGRAGQRRGPRNVQADQLEVDGLRLPAKYRTLGARNKANVARAIREGFVYQGTSATTEEQCCYGELRRRGFEVGENVAPRWFVPQYPVAGSVVDFVVGDRGERIALRPNNRYWHGHAVDRADIDEKGEQLQEAGYTVCDIWDGDTLSDLGIVARFDLFFGAE